jgi:hypothetical protein
LSLPVLTLVVLCGISCQAIPKKTTLNSPMLSAKLPELKSNKKRFCAVRFARRSTTLKKTPQRSVSTRSLRVVVFSRDLAPHSSRP